jgi:hypothetical protein
MNDFGESQAIHALLSTNYWRNDALYKELISNKNEVAKQTTDKWLPFDF